MRVTSNSMKFKNFYATLTLQILCYHELRDGRRPDHHIDRRPHRPFAFFYQIEIFMTPLLC